jgi:hypothetical protein
MMLQPRQILALKLPDSPSANNTAEQTPTQSRHSPNTAEQTPTQAQLSVKTIDSELEQTPQKVDLAVEKIKPSRNTFEAEKTVTSIGFSKSLQSSLALRKAAKRFRVFMICIMDNTEQEADEKKDEQSPLDFDENGILKKDYLTVKLDGQVVDMEEIIGAVIRQFNCSNVSFQLTPNCALYQLVSVEIDEGKPEIGFKLEPEDIPNCKYMGFCLANGVTAKDAISKQKIVKTLFPSSSALALNNEDKIPIKIFYEQEVHIVEMNRNSNFKLLFQAFANKKKLLISEKDFSGFIIKGRSECFDWESRVIEIPQESTIELRKKSPQNNVKVFKTCKVPEPEDFAFTKVINDP